MTLKDAIAADNLDVFLDLDEFAEVVQVEGKPIPVQLDSGRLGELAGRTEYAIGLDSMVMHARTADLPPARKAGDALMVGPHDWTVTSWEDRRGITTVALQRSV